MRSLKIIFLIFAAILIIKRKAHAFNPLIRRTRYGYVKGTLETSQANETVKYLSFMGIPYARPPIGKLRFQEPLLPNRWIGIKETTKQAIRCVQYSDNFNGPDIIGQEDCLYLNVFIPYSSSNNNKKLMPVLFWIHGGTFIFGSNLAAGPDYVMEKEVIVVSIQYRLNVFGFLTTLDKYAPGNYGLKDQLMALQWVKENIKQFNGDPNRVTIIGESAGGASVQYHLVSPKSKGLFQHAISHSGSTLSRWAHQEHPMKIVLKLAKGLGIQNVDSSTLIEKLQSIDYKTILAASFNTSIVGFYTPYYAQPFSPTIEKNEESAFLSKSTYDVLQFGNFTKVPYMLGYNTEEGSFAYDYIVNGRADINRYEEDPLNILPVALNISRYSICATEVVEQIRKFYFKNLPLNRKENWITFMSQELFVRSIRKSVEFMHNYTPLYFYRFSFRGSRNESYLGGVGHHEELMYLWRSRTSGANTVESKADMLTRQRLITMWTNFATTGNPTPKPDSLLQHVNWPAVFNKDKINFIDIGSNLVVGDNPEQEDYLFWENVFGMCGNPPYTSY